MAAISPVISCTSCQYWRTGTPDASFTGQPIHIAADMRTVGAWAICGGRQPRRFCRPFLCHGQPPRRAELGRNLTPQLSFPSQAPHQGVRGGWLSAYQKERVLGSTRLGD
jgi:hypothetical protein